ncbi:MULTISPECIES: lipoprotein-releasing ABC transporter permease subunit [Hydrocarboniphaga]|uniref:Lipoprotein releasing system, transmembrane protein, LolC/E family n=1 Tax=Hydrocarboniphaga effusa AP103 TaxID=1172194 RepID=I8HYT7_9GAMM|nr:MULTISPECIES: lipoprotein-releasing ABC transporter permease subunit [Hydrocarboniphaga]EIT68651.1 lipoprotein releasing system, transmembrane protein, LolC/E family [Hydrocarboniphaga effusa AP103]MDZ4076829.1 lipoprotein-releasing ABC transporter permease subunit [Hydrocarboniphaga sp.]
MRHPYELFAGLRYTRAKRRNHFISFISFASMLGIGIGVTALITVLSVMNGFERELRTRILGMASHATISAFEGGLADWPGVADTARKNPDVEAVAPYVEGEGMLRLGSGLSGTMLRGVLPDEERGVSDIGDKMVAGSLDDLKAGSFNIVIGYELAQVLGVTPGDKVDLMIPQASVTPAGVLPRFRRFTVSGIFKVGMYEFDRTLVLIHLGDAQSLYRMGDTVTGVRIKLHDMFKAPTVSRELAGQLQGIYYVNDWTRSHANFFSAVATEKMVMFIILSLIVGVAAFNIVSTLVMVVQDKQADIAILRTLGASPRSIMAIFMVQGSLIGIIGTVIGVVGGVSLALNVERLVPLLQALTGHQFLSPEVYYISDLPSELKSSDVIRISILSLALGLLSTLYPAWRASRVQPAEALRYE